MINYTPVQERYLEAQKKSRKARALHEQEKQATASYNAMYEGKASLIDEVDTKELNSYMDLP